MADDADDGGIPVLRDPVVPGTRRDRGAERPTLPEALRVELETELTARVHDLSETLVREAVQRVEAALFESISTELRARLPELIESTLEELLAEDAADRT